MIILHFDPPKIYDSSWASSLTLNTWKNLEKWAVATGSYAFYPTFIRFHCLFPLVNHRLMTRFMLNQTEYTLDSFLSKLTCPLLLLWGDLDPWVGPAKANRIKEFYPNTTLVNLKAGHCPHDEVPELANKALVDWLSTIAKKASSLQTVWKIPSFMTLYLITLW